MNPLFQTAAQNTELGWLLGLTTLLFLGSFLGWIAWAWSPSNRETLDAASRQPLDDDGGDL